IKLEEIPWVLQYNKRDLPNACSIDQLNAAFNPDGTVPWFEAVASQSKGVFETFRGVSHLLIERVTRALRRTPLGGRSSRSGDSSSSIDSPSPPGVANPLVEAPRAAGPDVTGDFGRERRLDAG